MRPGSTDMATMCQSHDALLFVPIFIFCFAMERSDMSNDLEILLGAQKENLRPCVNVDWTI